jgi:phosphate-selective porin OprO/OprP
MAGSVNWYLNAVTRFMLQYQDVRVDRLSPSATSFQTPAGAQIGQHYHTIALRSQLAF